MMEDLSPTSADQTARWWPETDSGDHFFVETRAGAVHVRRAGSGPALLLMHANGQSWREFDTLIADLARSFDVVAWDMPGQGESDPVHPRTSVEGYAEVLADVLDVLGLERVTLVGSSIGAFVAAAFENRHPTRVAGLALVEFQFLPERGRWEQLWPLVEQSFAVPVQSAEQVQARIKRPIDQALVDRWNVDRSRAGARSMMGVMWAIRMFDIAGAIRALRTAPLVVYGSESPTIAGRPALEVHLPANSRVVVIEGGGHLLAIDRPEELVAELETLQTQA